MKIRILALLLTLFVAAAACLAKGTPVTDDSITDQVRIKLASDQVVKGGAINVDVKQGVVTLSGPVELAQQKQRAEKLAKKVKGVKQVINNLTIRTRNTER
ncbi:MAG TPA: BON domain-containing protein [Bryobacteraceae bacterium]|nr:BON domain-containing protein [Bryobacteraceae bacterium]